jgi:sugar phosphate isomerase/epimerase
MMAADRSVITRIDDATAIIDELGRPEHLGVVVDAYHVWWDLDLEAQLQRAKGRVFGLHVSDWVSPLTGPLTGGRGMMGDGCIDLPALAALVADAGYDGPVEVEVISADLGSQDPALLLDTVVHRFQEAV